MESLPPLPKDFEPIFYETLEKVRGIAARVREEKAKQRPSITALAHSHRDAHGDAGGSRRITAHTFIPGSRAGLVIGNRGETLKRIERMAQVKLQFDQQYLGPNGEKKIMITAGSQQDVEEAIKMIKEKSDESDGGRHPTAQMTVPSHRVGLIIGKGGETIRELQDRSGARIMIAPDGGNDTATGERPIQITGDEEAIRKAKAMLEDLVTNGVRPSQAGMMGGRNTVTIYIPESSVGAVIGKRAETLKGYQTASNAKIFVESSLQPGSSKRTVHISGSPECVAYAQQLIEEKVRSVDTSGSYGQPYYDPAAVGGVIYQAPGEFASSMADPSAGAANFDYAQYYQQYYQQAAAYNQYYGYPQAGADASGQPQQQAFDYAAYAAQYAAAQQQPPQ